MARERVDMQGVFTPEISRFIDEYIACYGNATLAYMRAFENDNQKTARAEAHELLKRDDVKTEIAVRSIPYRKSLQEENDVIRRRLMAMIDGSDENASNADALRASDILNRMSARYIIRTSDETNRENVVTDLSSDELIKLINEKPIN